MTLDLTHDDRMQTDLPPTRGEGLRRLAAFVPRMGRVYAARRNFDLGPGDRGNVSLLSPWIARGLVTEAEVIAACLTRHSPEAAEKFIQEVCWRGYWRGWLEQRPGVWADYRAARKPPGGDPGQRIARAEAGQTGIDAFDAWARELAATGWLHNHARMWAASIWVHTLGLPWALGADWFLHHLVDADAAANTLSWRWVAGLHTPGKSYLARADNIAAYTQGRLAAAGLARAPRVPDAPPAPALTPIRAHRAPPFEQPTALVLTAEDLCLEQALPVDRAVAVALLDLGALRSPRGRGGPATVFERGALADAAARARAAGAPAAEWVDPGDLATWARDHGARALATGFAHTGWTRDAWVAAGLGDLALHEHRRPWDAALQPLARAGFFALKPHIPRLIAGLGAAT